MAGECVERPERFPELSSLSYGRANPVTFDAPNSSATTDGRHLVDRCLSRLVVPGLVTTTVEEASVGGGMVPPKKDPLPHRPADLRVAYRRRSYLSDSDRIKMPVVVA